MPSDKLKPVTDWDKKVFQSTHLHSGRYSPSTHRMELTFANGKQYHYAAPPVLWDKFKEATDTGRFFHLIVKPNFPGTLIDKDKDSKEQKG